MLAWHQAYGAHPVIHDRKAERGEESLHDKRPELWPHLERTWDCYLAASRRRPPGSAIALQDVIAFCDLWEIERDDRLWMLQRIEALDAHYLATESEKQKAEAEKAKRESEKEALG